MNATRGSRFQVPRSTFVFGVRFTVLRSRFAVRGSWLACASGIVALTLAVAAAQQPAPDRSKPPALGPAPELKLPEIQERTLSNGLALRLVESHEVPLVQVNLLILAGSAEDAPGKLGVASLTAAMLDEGAGTRSALEIADAVDFLGALLTTSSSFDASAVRLNVPVARLRDALPIVADVALRPTFPQKDLDRLRQDRLTSLLQARDDPASIADMAYQRLLFGTTSRYGTESIGTTATLKALTQEDLRAFHAARYTPSNAALIVVGDVRMDEVLPLLEQQFGGWKGEAQPRVTIAASKQRARRDIYIVDKPGAEQSQIRIGWIGVPRSTPDYFPIVVMNTILGGSFTSRLNQNLRETHGYAYGASSRFDMRRFAGPFTASAGVQTDKTAEAVREFFNELEGIRKPISADELTKAKNYLAFGFPADFETTGDLSRRIEEMIVYRLPENYFSQYVAQIQAVTPAGAQKAALTHVQPDRFAVVVVGDAKTIEPPLRALKLGPVRVMSVEEAIGQ